MSSDQFIFHKAWADALSSAPAEIRLAVLDAIILYATTGDMPQLSREASMAFQFTKQQIDRDQEKWQATREKRRVAGRMGGKARQAARQMLEKQANASNAKQNKQSQANQANQAIYISSSSNNINNIEVEEDIEANASNAKQNKQMLEKEESVTREQRLYLDLVESPIKMEHLGRLTKLTRESIIEKLRQFKIWAEASGATEHEGIRDLQDHFVKWLIAREKSDKQRKQNTVLRDNDKEKYKYTEKW